jgi:Holliday junction resolvase RusA-like endonuclease
VISFVVHGDPATQGNKTPYPVRRKDAAGEWEYTGKVAVVEGKSKAGRVKFQTWREAVKEAAVDAVNGSPVFPLDGPLQVAMIFTLRRPKRHFRSGASTSHLLREGAPEYPGVKPDLAKLTRAVEDAMRDAGVYWDDAQIVSYRPHIKVFTDDPMGLPHPGVRVKVQRMPRRRYEETAPARLLPCDAAAV